SLPVEAAVLDGEAVALRPDGRPHPFQVTGSRTGRQRDVGSATTNVPLNWYVFDVLHLDGTDLVAEPARTRFAQVQQRLPVDLVIPRLVTADPGEGEAFFTA